MRHLHFTVSLGTVLFVTTGCGGPIADDDPTSVVGAVAHRVQGVAGDPASAGANKPCAYNYKWNGTWARVYHPAQKGDCSKSIYSPLVVIMHAAGNSPVYERRDYDFLQKHLARNGFISASLQMDYSLATSDAASKAWKFVNDFMWKKWAKRVYIDPSSVALIGHSRGGEAVRYLAHQLESDPLFQVKAVVSMAAAASSGLHLDGGQTKAYLQLYGTNDGDTPPGGTFPYYDNAGDDGPQFDPVWNGDVIYKAVKLIEGANHPGYSDLGAAQQRNMVKGYILAFLAAHNRGDVTWYEDYIRGNAVPAAWNEAVFTSYSDGFYRRVIDNFDDGFIANTTIGGVMATFDATAQVLDASYPHDTDVLWTWASSTNGLVTWTIPAGKRNAAAFEWLSLRIAQLSGAPSNDLRVQIRNGLTWSPEVRLTDYGPIPQPTEMCFIQFGGSCSTQNHMATIRVPLSAFGSYDDVQHVRLRFRGDSVVDTFMIDNLEFSEFVLKP